jgi:monofunctional glycosyltransferase
VARRSRIGSLVRGVGWATLALACVFAGLVALYAFAPPVSTLMLGRMVIGKSYERFPVKLADVAPAALASVIASEDASFCRNDGVDWGALREVLGHAHVSRGASTITMQTAKNLFLWPGRSVLRKAIEIPMALVLGSVWSKTRTLEVYLNIAEWGDGTFGIEAASERYFHKLARDLDAREAALLATALPNPIKRDPVHPDWIQRRLAASIMARAEDREGLLDCLRR